MPPAPQSHLNSLYSLLDPPPWLLLPFAVVAFLDISITYYALYSISTPLVETNSLAVHAMTALGPTGLLVPYLIGITTWILLSLAHPWHSRAFRILGTVYLGYATYVVARNIALVYPHMAVV